MTPVLIIELVTALAPIATGLVEWINKANSTLKQSAELTPELDAQLDGIVAGLPKLPGYQIDPDPAPPAA